MSSRSQPEISTTDYTQNPAMTATAYPGQFEEQYARQQRMQRATRNDPWGAPPSTLSVPPPGLTVTERASASYSPFHPQQRYARDEWTSRSNAGYQDQPPQSPWPGSPMVGQYQTQGQMSPAGVPGARSNYTYPGTWPNDMLRRSSSEDMRYLNNPYYNAEASASTTSLAGKQFPQRRPSNRDEFDGPSQLLDKPADAGYEPKEEELPKLPVTLYAQEQDDILSKVNDRLAQCAFDFVAKYQFPIPIEPDKRQVRVPADREWSEWVYLLKRLATKRRIPARVLYNGQIKQLITILENSLEMRHAAKHQSRPLKDDRNILQLISSGLQVAKIIKDAPAMGYLDGLYVQTERLVQGRRGTASSTFGTLCIM